jgi:uncharacterized protein
VLVSFSVTNFRSFKERQTLQMEPSGKAGQKDAYATGHHVIPFLMQHAALYGANNTGKSNFIRAMDVFCDIVYKSATDIMPDDSLRKIAEIAPYKLSSATSVSPTVFEVTLLHKGAVYEYGIEVDGKIVHREWLFVKAAGKGTRRRPLIQRDVSNPQKATLAVDNAQQIKDQTSSSQLLLSVGAKNKSPEIRLAYLALRKLRVLTSLSLRSTARKIHKENEKKTIMHLMQGLDLCFEDIRINEEKFSEDMLPSEMPEAIKNDILEKIKNASLYKIDVMHKTEEGLPIWWPLEEESEGTQNLFAFTAPILDTLRKGYILWVDEIEENLHPIALEGILWLFSNPVTNPHGAQIIFTTHNDSILDALPHDSGWFIEKQGSSSTLTPLSAYKPRIDVSVQKRYRSGKYGAIPALNETILADAIVASQHMQGDEVE